MLNPRSISSRVPRREFYVPETTFALFQFGQLTIALWGSPTQKSLLVRGQAQRMSVSEANPWALILFQIK